MEKDTVWICAVLNKYIKKTQRNSMRKEYIFLQEGGWRDYDG
jgi:hypothetical protein